MLVLAFDADCHRCRAVAAAVARREPDLDVLPLRDYRVAEWRAGALGTGAPWAPTLLAVDEDDGEDRVRAWTGAAVVVGLATRLGPVRAARLTPALRPLLARGLRRRAPARDA